MADFDRDLLIVVRTLVPTVLGCGPVTDVRPLQVWPDEAVLEVAPANGPRLVVKLAAAHRSQPTRFERTAMLTGMARASGVPVPPVLAADDSGRHGRWRYLIAEHLEGVAWRRLRPSLGADEVDAAHRQLANAVLAVQSLRFGSFGELDPDGRPPTGQDLLTALHRRADTRIPGQRDRETVHRLLDRDSDLFSSPGAATLCHDDLHHGNVIFRRRRDGWRLAGLLDWDKAWAGPAESDVARMAFWDDMTGAGFWEVYGNQVPADTEQLARAAIYQLLWCLEYGSDTPRHRSDTTTLWRRLGMVADNRTADDLV